MKQKTAKQLLRLVINGLGLQTTLRVIADLTQAAGDEEETWKDPEKSNVWYRATHDLSVCADRVYNEDLDGKRLPTERVTA